VAVPLSVPQWTPPGADAARWRRALADDLVDLFATLAEVEPALAVVEADRGFAAAVAWPTMRVYALPRLTVRDIFEAAAADGFEQAAVIAPDVPDLPGMMIAKLLRPLTTRPVALAPAAGDASGLLGIACRLPVPDWLPEIDLETSTVAEVRAAAPEATDVLGTPGWHRLRTPASLGRLDPNLDGWEATRALLSGGSLSALPAR
jgi:glycosyltransferase A (GT-A) superfamily protein (DUF2064 family)